MNAQDLKDELQNLVDALSVDEEIREDLNAGSLENVLTRDLQEAGFLTDDSGFVVKTTDGTEFIITVRRR